MSKQKIHLVLGSGGARGIAHIGVIETLEKKGYEVVSVSGCSMGAVVGGIYAAGYLKEYKEWMLSLTKAKVYRLMDFTLVEKRGFIKGEKVFDVIKEFTGVPMIEDFIIPFTAVATDLVSKKEVWFQSGDLYRALRASVAIPGLLTPSLYGDQVLVDGAVLNPIPMNIHPRSKDEIMLVVNLYGPELNDPSQEENGDSEIFKEFKQWLNKITHTNLPIDTSGLKILNTHHENEFLKNNSIQDFVYYSYQLTRDRMIELMYDKYKPEIIIEIPWDICGTFDFHKTKELIEIGEQYAERAISNFEFDFKACK